jgi:hypothetical protein
MKRPVMKGSRMTSELRLLRTQRGCKMGSSSKRALSVGKDTSCAVELISMHVRGMALLQHVGWASDLTLQARQQLTTRAEMQPLRTSAACGVGLSLPGVTHGRAFQRARG